ncbi:hypothetical protein [Radicibacter daui]|uniref:hypothetical protein n=1 Tax=Radicibacter daui TaxID=3064829 RepID=UPI004046FDFF
MSDSSALQNKPVSPRGIVSALCATGVMAGQALALILGTIWAVADGFGFAPVVVDGLYVVATLIVLYGAYKYARRAVIAERSYQ